MSEDWDKIVPELDRLMMRSLELMEEEIKNKFKMQETIKDGCLDLAKTRYILGQRCVSSLQLPTEDNEEIKALTSVVSSEETTNKVPHIVYQLNIENPSKVTNSVKSLNSDVDGVRQRIKNVPSESKDSTDSDIKSDTDSDIKSEKDVNSEPKNGEIRQISPDPLKWFGVLVPQSLRKAQQSFQRALKLVVECATIQNELTMIQERFNVLYKEKQSLLGRDI